MASFNLADSFSKTKPKTDLFYVTFIALFHIGAVASLFFWSWTNVVALVICYAMAGYGITVGYHRLLTHRGFVCPVWVERIWAVFGNLAMEGGPITWVANHRQHHKHSDKDLDPHDISKGFWWAHMGWIFRRYPSWYEQGIQDVFAPDLQRDPFMRWLDRYHYFFPSILGIGLLAFGGWGAFLWGFCLRTVLTWHSTWLVNSAAHIWGYRPFKNERATNNWWVAIVALGEGWHNNHHRFPTSARHGLRAWEFDSSWVLIWTMKKLGLAKKIKLPQPEELPWNQRQRAKLTENAVHQSSVC